MQPTAEWLDIDYYDVLGVTPDATAKQIKSAYRKLARTAHPDANPDDPQAEERFSNIAKAYEVLGDDESRTEYDDLRRQAQHRPFESSGGRWQGAPAGTHDFVDLSDLFGDVFAEQQRRPRRGADTTASLALDFVDAVTGLTTTLTIDGRNTKVRIPAGVEDGQTIRLAGKGSPGMNGGPAGDLFIRVDVGTHPRFARSAKNLTTEIEVPYEDAVLGADIPVEALDGSTVTVRVPPGTTSGTRLRIKGKGVPARSGAGDLVVTVRIRVPKDVSDQERSLLEQLRTMRVR